MQRPALFRNVFRGLKSCKTSTDDYDLLALKLRSAAERLFHSQVSQNMLYKPLLHSLLIASSVSVLSILIGSLIAWLMVRSDLPAKGSSPT